MSMFQSMGSLGIDLTPTYDATTQQWEYVPTPTGPAQTMPTGPQPPGTVLQCAYDASNDADPGTCYYAYPAGNLATVNVNASGVPSGGGLTAAQVAANAAAKAAALKNNAPATFMGMPMSTLVMVGFFGLIGVAVLSAAKGK